MAFASPSASSRKILSLNEVSTSGTKTFLFTIPQDTDSLVAKIWLASGWSASGTATITIQTTEDGGTTWRDVAGTTIGAATVAADVNNDRAHFIDIGCIGSSDRGVANYIGSVQASTLALAAVNASAIGTTSGMVMMGTLGRVQIVYTATISTGGVLVDIFAPTTEYR